MITTVNLNPCIDKTIFVRNFLYGALNRAIESRADFSGKAINVAVAVKQMGREVECLGFNYEENGAGLEKSLADKEIPFSFVKVPGAIRTNMKIQNLDDQVLTEVNEKGAFVSQEAICELKKIVKEHASQSSTVIFGGSVPQGVSSAIYRELIQELEDFSVRVILDAEKELLLEGIKAKPYMIKPNIHELEAAFGVHCKSKEDVLEAARAINKMGIPIVCVSMGEEGALICSAEEAFFAPALQLEVRGLAGAGDSMVAGIAVAMEKKLSLKEMLRYGMAASAASLVLDGTQMCDWAGVEKYLGQIEIQEIGIRS